MKTHDNEKLLRIRCHSEQHLTDVHYESSDGV